MPGGRHVAAPARRAAARHPLPKGRVGLVLLAVAVLLVSVVGWRLAGGPSCDGPPLTVAAAPEIAPVVDTVSGALEADGFPGADGCTAIEVQWADPGEVLTALHAGDAGDAGDAGQQAPDVWIPDTSAWLSRLPADLRKRPTRSIAKTPVVLAGRSDAAQPASWLDALSQPGADLLDPRSSGASVGALAALHAEAVRGVTTGTELSRWLVAKAQSAPEYSFDDAELLDNAANAGDAVPAWFPTTEQRIIQHVLESAQTPLRARLPRSGTVLLDYPMVPVARGEREDLAVSAAEALGERLLTPAWARRLAAAGYRPASGVPTEARSGVGVVEEIGVVNAAGVSELLSDWLTLTADARMLAVLDVSGSMGEYAGVSTRVGLARDAATTAVRGLPGGWQVGLWAFSVGLGDGTADHRELAPVRDLDDLAQGTTQRGLLARTLQDLPSLVGGGTALYDTTLAAYRSAVAGYAPGRFNSVVLLTDGRNEDPEGLDLPALLDTLRREHDPQRPVQVITIGMGPEADVPALRRIAAATGGASYVARDPRALEDIFADALLERVGWGMK